MALRMALVVLVAGATMGIVGDGQAQTTPWPTGQADLRPGISESKVRAPALDDVGVERACDIKIVVEQLSKAGAGELWGNLENRSGGAWTSLKLRSDGLMDFLYTSPSRRITTSGVLSRIPN